MVRPFLGKRGTIEAVKFKSFIFSDLLMSNADFEDELENPGDVAPALDEERSEVEASVLGKTSKESEPDASDKKPKRRKLQLSVYEAMLLVSLVCVTLATLLLFWELSNFGNILLLDYPWRTSDV